MAYSKEKSKGIKWRGSVYKKENPRKKEETVRNYAW
jgi:hypothetical protein